MKDAIFELLTAIAPGDSRAIMTADSVSRYSQKTMIPPDALDDLTEILGIPAESSGPSGISLACATPAVLGDGNCMRVESGDVPLLHRGHLSANPGRGMGGVMGLGGGADWGAVY